MALPVAAGELGVGLQQLSEHAGEFVDAALEFGQAVGV